MKKLAAALLAIGFVVLCAPPAGAAPPGTVAHGDPPTSVAPSNWIRLAVTSLSPRTVTSTDTSVTVSVSVTNISDRKLSHLKMRLQRGDAVTSDAEFRSALSASANPTRIGAYTTPVTLNPGQTASITVTAPLQGPNSLDIGQPGTYPMLVNVQGEPDYGSQARLAVAGLMLPVLSTPGSPRPAPTGNPARLTVLWPLVDDVPRVVGNADGQVVLADDQLAGSLAPGGRLFGLVDSVTQQSQGDPALLASLCFAIDPDLLDTVSAMTGGYQVRTATGTVKGQGSAAANAWLASLRRLTAQHCVLALPYADADLVALARAGATDLEKLAMSGSADVAGVLGAAPLTDTVWPADGEIDPHTLAGLTGLGVTAALLNPAAMSPVGTGEPVALQGVDGTATPRAVPIDELVSGPLAGGTDQAGVDEQAVATQNGLAALLYRTVFAGTSAPVLVAPPRRWQATDGELSAFLQTVRQVVDGHFATAADLPKLTSSGPSGAPATLSYPPLAAAAEVPNSAVAEVVADDVRQQDLLAAMSSDHATPVAPSKLIGPLRIGLLRAVSSAWRDGQGEAAVAALRTVRAEYDSMVSQVFVVPGSQTISLASQDSRPPVTVTNLLPVDITVRVKLSGEAGLRPASTDNALILAHSSRTLFIQATVTRSGRFSILASASTPGGTALGSAARLELVSSAYGTIMLVVTATAFGALVLLSGRRVYRRVRAARTVVAAPGVVMDGPDQREPDEH